MAGRVGMCVCVWGGGMSAGKRGEIPCCVCDDASIQLGRYLGNTVIMWNSEI